MAAGSALFTLLGLVFVVVGPTSENRQIGVMCLLLFGLGPAVYLGNPLLTRRGRGEIRLGRAGGEPAFVFPTPRSKTALQLTSAIGMAGGTLLLYFYAGGWVLAACSVLFGLFLLLALYRAVRPQRLVLTPTRVLIGSTQIPWEGIDDVDLYEMPAGHTTVDMVGISASDLTQPAWMRLIGRLGRGLSEYDVVVGADSLSRTGEEVIAVLRRYRAHPAERRRIGDEGELARLHRLPSLAGRT